MGHPSDFARLELLVRELTSRYSLLRAENEALQGRLEVKEHQISMLQTEAGEAEVRRKSAIDHLDQLVDELGILEGRAAQSSAKASPSSYPTAQNAPPAASG